MIQRRGARLDTDHILQSNRLMSDRNPTKNFGIRDASDLLGKLRFDLARLKAAKMSNAVRYAALDCSLVSFHMVDWVLQSVSPERCLELCGKAAGDHGSVRSFIKRNTNKLPHLATCDVIANTGKHLALTWRADDGSVVGKSTVRFDPPFEVDRPETWATAKAYAVATIKTAGGEIDAVDFFQEVLQHWNEFLDSEGLLTDAPPEPGNVFA